MTANVIDLTALRALKDVIGDDPALMAEFVEVFTRTVPEQLSEIRGAMDAHDLSTLRIAAHGCKSNARDMGAVALTDLCATLERQCRAGALDDAEAQIDAIEAQAKRAIEVLNALDLSDV